MKQILSVCALVAGVIVTASAQAPPSSAAAAAARAGERIRALQREADQLAGQERTLLGQLRKLEVERDLRAEEAKKLDVEVAAVSSEIERTEQQIRELQAAADAARPALQARLVDVYKLGRPGYARLVLGVGSLRDAGRTARLVSALAAMDQRRVNEYTTTVTRLTRARSALDGQSAQLHALQADARRAAALAVQAAAARASLVREIDARRDLNAQMVGELELTRQKLQQSLAGSAGAAPSAPAERVVLPIKPFRGALDWPVNGRLSSRFGQQRSARFGIATLQNGIEVEAPLGTPVRAVHEGRVAFADVFAGFGQLVIVDHGGLAFTLYGYLESLAIQKGATVAAGQTLGATGHAPAGNSAVYFELRIDGKPVDPLQWLKAK